MAELNYDWSVRITMILLVEDRYFCNSVRLAYDQPWQIFMVQNDLSRPYYCIYVGGRCMGFAYSETEAYSRVKHLTSEQTHDPTKF